MLAQDQMDITWLHINLIQKLELGFSPLQKDNREAAHPGHHWLQHHQQQCNQSPALVVALYVDRFPKDNLEAATQSPALSYKQDHYRSKVLKQQT